MDVLEDLRSHISFSEKHIEDIRFDQQHAPDLYGVGIYCSVLELSTAIHTLCNADCITGLEVVIRSQLEAFVDLKNISHDESYHLNMEAADTQQWIRLMEKARDPENLFINGLAGQPEFEEDFEKKKRRLHRLQDIGRGPLQPWQRFRQAGLHHEYNAIYNQLCTEGHNNIRALTSRHFDINHEEESLRVVYKKNSHDGSYDHLITMTSGVLLRSGVLVHKPPVQESFMARLEDFDRSEQEHHGLN